MMQRLAVFLMLSFNVFISGCQESPPPAEKETESSPAQSVIEPPTTSSDEQETPASEERQPPRPPLKEDFQAKPKISLFPRAGDFQPPLDDESHSYWRTFIDHLIKITKVVENQADGNRGWVFRSIKSIDSVGYFAPVAIEPETDYQVSFEMTADLPEGASAGIGILEFDEFLWIGEQYNEAIYQDHYQGFHEGLRLKGTVRGLQTFTFRTGPKSHMAHLVLFRDGPHDRSNVMFDNLEIR